MWSVTESSHPTSLFQRSLVSGAMDSSLRCSPKTDATRLVTARVGQRKHGRHALAGAGHVLAQQELVELLLHHVQLWK
jgi:hypothetical protein